MDSTISTENLYILLFIICIIGLLILIYTLWKQKYDKFNDITTTSTTNIPTTPSATISSINNISMASAISQLDGNQETITSTLTNTSPNISQMSSTLYSTPSASNIIDASNAETTINNSYSLGLLGTKISNTVGGIKTNLGYSILEDEVGSFIPNANKQLYTNPNTYDNTANYNTGMNPDTINGNSSSGNISTKGYGLSKHFKHDESQVFLQKDFAGVANIFAPNIFIENPPLNSDGYPNISFDMQ